MNQATLGLLRGVGMAILIAVLTYFGDAAHLNGVVSPVVASLIASVVLAIEHGLASGTDKALFGSVRTK